MTTPTPLRADLDELLSGLQQGQGRAVRLAIVRAVHALFDAATAQPARAEAISDTNGSDPAAVESRLFVEPSPTELAAMPKTGEHYYGPLA